MLYRFERFLLDLPRHYALVEKALLDPGDRYPIDKGPEGATRSDVAGAA